MEWKCHIHDASPTFFGQRVVFYRHLGDDTIEAMVGVNEHGDGVLQQFPRGVAVPTDIGLIFPLGAVEALAEAVKPGPSSAELKVLNDALDLERSRVDNVLRELLVRQHGGT